MRTTINLMKSFLALALILVSVYPVKANANETALVSAQAFQLTLSSFSYIPVNVNSASFTWTTTQEFDVEKFQLQGSSDSIDFVTVDEQAAVNYKFGHVYYSPVISIGQYKYYRVAMVNENGLVEYSQTIHVENTAITKQDISIFPNPVTGLHFNIKVPTMNPVAVNVFTREGVLIYSTNLRGMFQYQIELPSRARNAFNLVVQISTNDKTQSFNVLNK